MTSERAGGASHAEVQATADSRQPAKPGARFTAWWDDWAPAAISLASTAMVIRNLLRHGHED
jgi:hypothetical protein